IWAILISIIAFGQHELGIKANGGVSKISEEITSIGSKFSTYFAPSGSAGVFYNYKLNNKSAITLELLFTQIEGKTFIESAVTDQNGNATGEITTSDVWILKKEGMLIQNLATSAMAFA
ncbi:MAG: hypothetical protein H0W84_04390, partial [Bacteroidetes bacterium]|nr:hypothetical protein [Bacteroidota bacterium]